MSAHALPKIDAGGPAAPGAKANPPLVIGEGVRIAGNLSCDAHLQIDGLVEGDVRARTITIGPSGTMLGTLAADDVLVLGAVTGIVEARSVTLGRSAKMAGDLVQETLCIELGAIFAGVCRRPVAADPPKPAARRPALLTGPTVAASPDAAPKEPVPAE